MLFFIGLNGSLLCPRKRRTLFGWCASRRNRVFAALMIILTSGVASAQTRSTPSHGKTRFDSFNYLLRDVHPASQAMANYLQNLLYLQAVKRARRLEKHDRVDAWETRLAIKHLEFYQSVAGRLTAGRPTLAKDLPQFWALVSVFGDRAEVYQALTSEVPPVTHDDFMLTDSFLQIIQPSGELVRPPLLLEGMEEVDASAFQSAWNAIAKSMKTSGGATPQDVAAFHKSVDAFRQLGSARMVNVKYASGRGDVERYLRSLNSLSDALYRPKQNAQIQQCIAQGGYAYYGGSMLGLCQHILKNRVTPAQGSTAQVALAELARPINRVLEQEIALLEERIDSLDAGEGHRPYAAEYRGGDVSPQSMPGLDVTQAEPAANAGI